MENIVGSENLLTGAETAPYALGGIAPGAVAFPGSREEVAALVRLAGENGWSLVPHGGGTQWETGFPPERFDLVVSLRRMDRVVDYQPDDMTITVEPGIPLATLQQTLAERRQFLPLNPPLPERATAGGTVAAAAVGPWGAGYGSPRDWVIGCRVVGADAQEVRGGGLVVKNVAGYDLPKLYTGSFGTLGILTEVTFKVMPAPADRAYCRVFLQKAEDAETLVGRIRDSDLIPASVELVHTVLWQSTSGPVVDRPWTLFLEFHHVPEALQWQLDQVGQMARDLDAGFDALPAAAGEPLLAALRDRPARHRLIAKLVVVSSRVAGTAAALTGWCEKRGLPPLVVAHAVTGQVYLCADGDFAEADVQAIREIAQAHRGSCVFQRLPEPLVGAIDPWGTAGPELRLMQGIKTALDPTGLFSPGRFVGHL